MLHHENQFLYPELLQEANELLSAIQTIHSRLIIELTGDLKRKLPYSNSIEFLIDGSPDKHLFDELADVSEVELKEDSIAATWKGFYKVFFIFQTGLNLEINGWFTQVVILLLIVYLSIY